MSSTKNESSGHAKESKGGATRARGLRFRPVALGFAALIILYLVAYACFSRRAVFPLGDMLMIQYPGMMRSYAFSDRGAETLSGQFDENDDSKSSVQLSKYSVAMIRNGWHNHVWRIFYPAERMELAWRKCTLSEIPAPRALVADTSVPPKDGLPLLGVYSGEWTVRGSTLYRFMHADYGARDAKGKIKETSETYLLEWPLGGEWGPEPRIAETVRKIEDCPNGQVGQHWLVNRDHFIIWDKESQQASLMRSAGEGKPFSRAATIDGIGPIACNENGEITVSPTGRFLAGERQGLTVFSGETFEVVRSIPETKLKKFYEARPDELSNTNSSCYLMDDGRTLMRVVTSFKRQGDDFIDGTIVIVLNLETGETEDIPIQVGLRSDVKHVVVVDGKLVLYLICCMEPHKWKQCVYYVDEKRVVDTHPANVHADSSEMYMDATATMLVDLAGLGGVGSVAEDSEICIESPGGKRVRGVVRHRDAKNLPAMLKPGIMKFEF